LRRLPLATSGTPMPIAAAAAKAMSAAPASDVQGVKLRIRPQTQSAAMAPSAGPEGVGLPVQLRTAVNRNPTMTAKT